MSIRSREENKKKQAQVKKLSVDKTKSFVWINALK